MQRTTHNSPNQNVIKFNALKQAGFKPSAIVLQLNRHPPQSSIQNYAVIAVRPRQAQQMADNCRRKKAIHEETWCIVNDLIVQDWSPEQISGWLAVEKNVRISHQHIARDKKRARKPASSLTLPEKEKKGYGGI